MRGIQQHEGFLTSSLDYVGSTDSYHYFEKCLEKERIPIEWDFWTWGGLGHAVGSEGTSALTQGIVDQIQQTSANYLMNYSNHVNAISE